MRYVLALTLLLFSSTAMAQLHECTLGGQVDYQNVPCEAHQHTLADVFVHRAKALVGCYDTSLDSSGTRRNAKLVFEIRATHDGYELRSLGGKDHPYSQTFILASATRRQLRVVGAATHTHLRAGLTAKWNTGNEPAPTGVYEGEDSNGRAIYLVFFHNGYGAALKRDCAPVKSPEFEAVFADPDGAVHLARIGGTFWFQHRPWLICSAETQTQDPDGGHRHACGNCALATHLFLANGRYSIADMAVFAYASRAEEAGLSLEPYPYFRAWIARVKAQPGFLPTMHSYGEDPHTAGELP